MDVGDRLLSNISSGKYVCGSFDHQIYCKKGFTEESPEGEDWTSIHGGIEQLDVDNSNSKYCFI